MEVLRELLFWLTDVAAEAEAIAGKVRRRGARRGTMIGGLICCCAERLDDVAQGGHAVREAGMLAQAALVDAAWMACALLGEEEAAEHAPFAAICERLEEAIEGVKQMIRMQEQEDVMNGAQFARAMRVTWERER